MADDRSRPSSTNIPTPRRPNSADPATVISKRPPPVADPAPKFGSTAQEISRSLEGQRLGHFQLEQFIGGGGMGAVFRGSDTKLGRVVAIKILSRDRTDEDTVRRFQNEAQSAARLDHPNIARVYYVGEDLGWNYIVFEYIDGKNIRDLVLERGPLPLDEIVPYLLQLAEALDHASRRDVVHRDIKPSNILVMADGHVKLVDMGLARLHQVEASSADLTATGVTLGTFDYISPEQARDPRSADVRSDLYSLGCTLFYMLTGQPPFPGGTLLQKLINHNSLPPPDIRTFRPDIGDEAAYILERLLAKQPQQRYQTPTELIGALLLLADHLGIEHATPSAQVWVATEEPGTRFVRQIPWLVPVALLLLGVIGVQWFWPRAVAFDPARMRPVYAAHRPTNAAEPDDSSSSATKGTGGAGSGLSEQSADDSTARGANDAKPADETTPSTESGDAANSSTGAAGESPKATTTNRSGVEPGTKPAIDPSSGSAPSAAAAPVPTRRIVIGPSTPPAGAEPGVRYVEEFDSAIEIARHEMSVDTLELQWDGELKVDHCHLQLLGRRLVVRAAPRHKPVVAFQPATGETSVERQMIRLTQTQLAWEGVALLFVLPPDPYDNWALFALDRGSSLEFNDCLVTVRNLGRDGQAVNRVACVEWLRSAPEMMAPDRPLRPGPPPLVSLRNTIVRGQATLVRTREGIPFRLAWHQGLFASTEPLVSAAGASAQPAVTDGLQLDLQHVTLALGGAMCQMQMDVEHRFPWTLVCRMIDSIVLKSTGPGVDPSSAVVLVEQLFTAPVEPIRKRPFVSGSGNYYPPDTVLLKVEAPGFAEESAEYTLADRDRARDEKWYDEQPTLGMVMWEKLPVDQPVDRQTKLDFVLDPTPQNPAREAGFDPAVLPDAEPSLPKPADRPADQDSDD